jgi:hypothetical protein
MLEKADPPAVSEEYAVSVAFACMLDTVRSVSSLVTIELPYGGAPAATSAAAAVPQQRRASVDSVDGDASGADAGQGPKDLALLKVMVGSSFADVTHSLALLLDRGEMETVIDPILKAFTSMVRVCGALELGRVRDGIIQVFCAACTPQGYSIVSDTASTSWAVSKKNLLCVHALANTSLCLGCIFEGSWLYVIATFQLVVTLVNPPNQAAGGGHGDLAGTVGARPPKGSSMGHRKRDSGSFAAVVASADQVPLLNHTHTHTHITHTHTHTSHCPYCDCACSPITACSTTILLLFLHVCASVWVGGGMFTDN